MIILGIGKSLLSQTDAMLLTLATLFFNGFLSGCMLVYFSKRGIIIDDIVYNKKVRENRRFLLAWGSVILFLECLAVYLFKKPEPLFAILFSLFLLITAIFSINNHRKISLHSSGITFFALTVGFVFNKWFWLTLILIPLVCWSRLFLVRHTINQLLAGFFLSVVTITAVFYFFDLIF